MKEAFVVKFPFLKKVATLGVVAGLSAGIVASVAFLIPSSGAASTAVPTKGAIPAKAMASGTIDWSQVPDYVSVTANGSIVGYVKKTALMPTAGGHAIPGQQPSASDVPPAPTDRPQPPVVTVYGPDLSTVVGHEVPGQGFVPVGG